MIRRRAWLAGLAAALLAPRQAAAARPARPRRIGWLSPAAAGDGLPHLDALRAGLQELGHVEGQGFLVESRWANGRSERLPALAAELVRVPVEVICTAGSQASVAARQATSTIPVVFANVAFPDRSGLVASYAHPGGNVTGVAFVGPDYGKRLELLKEAVPRLSRVALVYNPDNPGSVQALEETRRWTSGVGVTVTPHAFRGLHDLDGLRAAIAAERPDALMTTADPIIAAARAPIVELAATQRLPAMYPSRDFVEAGGLVAYGASIPEMFRRAAGLVDRILKGARPADLAVEQPSRFDVAVNLRTAKALGLTLPRSLLLRADHVVE
jgi:putative ABC transport system substrate-binding protein